MAPPTPIENLFKQLHDGMLISAAAGEPQVDAQVARLGYNIILKTGLFAEACREWRLKPDIQQTFAEFKLHFRRMNVDRQETLTAGSAGYHGAANAVTAEPPASPWMDGIMQELQLLRAAIAFQTPAANAAQEKPPTTAPLPLPPTSYCWTHGASRNNAHTSSTCNNQAEGHQVLATLTNRMGGSDRVWTHSTRRTTL